MKNYTGQRRAGLPGYSKAGFLAGSARLVSEEEKKDEQILIFSWHKSKSRSRVTQHPARAGRPGKDSPQETGTDRVLPGLQ